MRKVYYQIDQSGKIRTFRFAQEPCLLQEQKVEQTFIFHQKTASTAVLVSQTSLLNDWSDNLMDSIQQNQDKVIISKAYYGSQFIGIISKRGTKKIGTA